MEATKLNPAQQHLLKLFSHLKSEEALQDLKKVLVEYYARRVDEESERVFEERGYDEHTIDEWLNTHMRTPYQR